MKPSSCESEIELLKDEQGREVAHFVTPSGVMAWVPTDIPAAALEALARRLERRIERRKQVLWQLPLAAFSGNGEGRSKRASTAS